MSITVIKDPANISDHEAIEIPEGARLSDWIMKRYGADGFEVPTRVFSGGISDTQEIPLDDFKRINAPITANIYIVHRPLGLDPISSAILTGLASQKVVEYLIPIPTLPEGERQDRKSPNNSLSGQSNIARPLERVPDIFGEVKSYPDLINTTVFEFVDHILFATEYMDISRGFLDITEIKSGDTLVSNIVGSSEQVFEPGQSPTEVLKTTESNEVKSLTLNPPNDSGVNLSTTFILDYITGTDTGLVYGILGVWEDYTIGSSVTFQDVYFDNGSTELTIDEVYIVEAVSDQEINIDGFSVSYSAGLDEATIFGDFNTFVVGSLVTIDNCFVAFPLGNVDGVYGIKSKSASSVVLISAAAENSNWSSITTATITGSGTQSFSQSVISLTDAATKTSNWTDAALPKNIIGLLAITESRILEPFAFLPDQIITRGPFVVPGGVNDEIWLDFSAPRGLARDTNKNYTITVTATFEEIDNANNPTGPSFTVDYSFTDNDLDPRNYTRKITTAEGMEAGKRYRASTERTSNTDLKDETLIDQFKWTRLAGIDDITEADTTGTTRIQIRTQATEQTTSLQDRRFNMRAARRVVTWNGTSVVGDIDTGAGLVASSRMADIFLHYSLDTALAARDISQIDVVAIFAIQDNLDLVFDGELGEFNYTFDNQNTPALEELRQIANAARCSVFREGSIISIVRDEKQLISRALFNRRNKQPESETKTITFNKPLDNDGVQLEYRDKTDNKTKTILLPDDLPSDDPNFNLPNTKNPLKVEATGVTNTQQAWNRAQYELNRIIHNRVTVETGVTEEGILLPLNARIDHVDGTTLARVQSNGEITEVNGLIVTTSERCIFESGKTYSAIVRNDVGEPDPVIGVTARSDTEFGFILDSSPSFTLFIRGENDYQVGTLYNFAPDGDELSNQYLVQRKTPDSEGNVTLELINYTDSYYQADTQLAPTTRAYSDGYDTGFE